MSNGMRLLIDMDDVLENLCEAWVDVLNEFYKTDVKYTDIKEWDMTKAFPTLTADEIYHPLETEYLWKRVKPKEGAYAALLTLLNLGYDVKVVTASNYKTIPFKIPVLLHMFPFLTMKDIVITSDKNIVMGDVIIDDNPDNLKNCMCLRLLMSAPYNYGYRVCSNNMIRVDNWKEIVALLSDIKDVKKRVLTTKAILKGKKVHNGGWKLWRR